MSLTFDFVNELIEVGDGQVDVAVQDLVDAIRTAEATETGIVYNSIAGSSGKETLGPGVAVGVTVELLGSWQLHFEPGDYIAKVAGGNLVGGPAGDPIAYSAGVQVLLIQSAASTVVTVSTGSGLSVEEHDQLMLLPTTGLDASRDAKLTRVEQLLRNKRVLDPATGIETIYDDNGNVLFTRNVFEDPQGSQPYRGQGAERVERYT